MSDPKIIYTAILFKSNILLENFDQYGEIINYIKDKVLPATSVTGVKIINEDTIDHMYSRDSDQICLFVSFDNQFNKEMLSNYLADIKKYLFEHHSLIEIKKMKQKQLQNYMLDFVKEKTREYNIKWMDKSKIAL